MTADDFGDLSDQLAQRWGIDRLLTGSIVNNAIGAYTNSRGTIQSRVRRAFRRAGPDAQPVRGALVHGLRHTYATELANSEVSVYTLMKLLGHESMATSQRYVAGAARETRTAAALNPLYGIIRDRLHRSEHAGG